MTPYQPISCALHSEYELAIMRRRPLQLQWKTAQGTLEQQRLLPTDLVTRPDGEFLIALSEKNLPIEIRLDQIIEESPPPQTINQSTT